MSAPVRVLLVDDSVVVRRLLADILATDPELEVVGAAANGRLALARLTQTRPDIVILDVEMPEMDGLETLTEIRRLYPRMPVIMFSTLTERGAAVTLEALSLGAADYVTKPSNSGGLAAARQQVADQLIPRIRTLTGRRNGQVTAGAAAGPIASVVVPKARLSARMASDVVELVAIGVSTGGPQALADLIPALPGDLPVPVMIVQHMPPVFTRLLAERLDKRSALRVVEAEDGMPVERGTVYLAPGDHHLTVTSERGQSVVRLNQNPPEQSCRPAVDPLFRSAVNVYGAHVLAVVLTGMGSDGMRGAAQVHEAGGTVIVQDEASSVVWGMPGAVAQAGLADAIVPLSGMRDAITSRAAQPMRAGR